MGKEDAASKMEDEQVDSSWWLHGIYVTLYAGASWIHISAQAMTPPK
jgi:hypothetical protein